MCMFNDNVSSVNNTKLFVGPVTEKQNNQTWQFTVYSNEVGAPRRQANVSAKNKLNAMVLPFPVPEEIVKNVDSSKSHLVEANKDVIQFVNLKPFEQKHGKFFTVVNHPFTLTLSRSAGLLLSSDSLLEVVQVGDYSCSVARTLNDLKRVDASVFNLSSNLEAILSKYYASGYGFVIAAFDAAKPVDTNDESSHPIAYIHHRLPTGEYFVPTRHEHDGKDVSSVNDWDHAIYGAGTGELISSKNARMLEQDVLSSDPFQTKHRQTLSDATGDRFVFPTISNLIKVTVEGRYDNTDFAFSSK